MGSRPLPLIPHWMKAVALVGVLVLAPSVVAAELQEYLGEIVAVSGSSISVQNRLGDRRSFARDESTKIAGARKTWDSLSVGDAVIVYWDFADNPVKARSIQVRPSR